LHRKKRSLSIDDLHILEPMEFSQDEFETPGEKELNVPVRIISPQEMKAKIAHSSKKKKNQFTYDIYGNVKKEKSRAFMSYDVNGKVRIIEEEY